MFNVVCTVALPLITSAYLGIAERAAELAIEAGRKRKDDPEVQFLVGELGNDLFIAQVAWAAQIANANEFSFDPADARAVGALQAKTVIAEATQRVVNKAVEVVGGSGYYKKNELERLMRDVRAANFHPMPTKRQQRFTGRLALGLPPL